MVFKALRSRSRKRQTKKKEAKQKPATPKEDHPLKNNPALYPPAPAPTHSTSSSTTKDAAVATPTPAAPQKQSREIATQTSPCPSLDFDSRINSQQLQDDRDPSARGSPSRQASGEGTLSQKMEGSDGTPATIWASQNEDDGSELDDISRAETGASSMYGTEYSQGDLRTDKDRDRRHSKRKQQHNLRTVSMSESSSVSLLDLDTDLEETIGDTTNLDGTLGTGIMMTEDESMVENTLRKKERDWDEYLCPKPEYKVCGMTF